MEDEQEERLTWEEWLSMKITDDLENAEWNRGMKGISLRVGNIAEKIFESKEFYKILVADLRALAIEDIQDNFDYESMTTDICNEVQEKLMEDLFKKRKKK